VPCQFLSRLAMVWPEMVRKFAPARGQGVEVSGTWIARPDPGTIGELING
jgi:hypothetical protein